MATQKAASVSQNRASGNRYGDLLPPSYVREGGPLFSLLSPSMAAARSSSASPASREQVLHSLFSPPGVSGAQSTPYKPKQVIYTPAVAPNQSFHTATGRSLYFSPTNTAISSLESPTTHNPHVLNPPVLSSNLDVKALSLDAIQKCSSREQLREIITFLQERGSFPGLLAVAQRKIQNISKLESVIEDERLLAPEKDDSTLIMSLSTDILSPRTVIPEPMVQSSDTSASPSSNEIIKLRHEIEEMREKHGREQADFLDRIQGLERAKAQAERQLAAILGPQDSREQVISSLRRIQGENRLLQLELENERVRRREQETELTSAEQELARTSQQLQKHLNDGVLQTSSKVNELNALLRSAQSNLDRVREERDAFVLSLLKVSGKASCHVHKMTRSDRERVVEDFIADCLSTSSAVGALSASLSQSEKDRLLATRAKNKAESRNRELSMSYRKLNKENEDLVRRICALDEELSATRNVSQKLVALDADKRDWEDERAMFNRLIKGLRKKLARNDKMVPFDLYKAAVDEARALRASSSAAASRPVISQRSSSTPVPPKTPVTKRAIHVEPVGENADASAVRPRRVVFVDQNQSKNGAASTPHAVNKKVSFFSPSCNAGSATARRGDVVRAVGGRFALKDKVDQLRSPRTTRPLATRNS